MHHGPRVFIAVCFLAAVAYAQGLTGCAKSCPNGSGLLNGKCLPVQQPAASGATAEQELASTASGTGAQAAPPVNNREAEAGAPSVKKAGSNTAAAGAGMRTAQQNPRAAAADAGAQQPPTAACSPSEELCDNLDNDCDGKIDEEVTKVCQDLPAPCQAGVVSCHVGEWDDEATQCVGAIGPTDEICDDAMVDENCNGTANEGCACNENETKPCGRSEGVCKPGVQRCSNGMWMMECEGAVGEPNEGCQCLSGTSEMCNAGKGVCAMGERQCQKGMWSSCKSLMQSSAELCDNLDNDCNGIVDGPGAKCDKPGEKCIGLGVCAECVLDQDCSKMTTGCDVGKCSVGTCRVDHLEEYAACTSGSTRGYCVKEKCTAPRKYRIENTDQGSGDGQVSYSPAWPETGAVSYSNSSGAYFVAHFQGTTAAVYGGKGPDRGRVRYSICDANGSGCTASDEVDNYVAGQVSGMHRLWASPTVPFGDHTLRGDLLGPSTDPGHTDQIIDLDYVDVN